MRPGVFFDPDGNTPETAELAIEKPEQFAEYSEAEWVALIRGEVKRREDKARERARRSGQGFLGAKRVMAQDWRDTPATFDKRRGISPTVAAGNKWLRIERLQEDAAFVAGHEEARLVFIAGDRDVVFPYGSFWWKRFGGANCAPRPPG